MTFLLLNLWYEFVLSLPLVKLSTSSLTENDAHQEQSCICVTILIK